MNLKNWWENLLDRERKILSVSGGALAILLIYALIWSPLSGAVLDKEKEVSSQQQVLQYLRHVAETVQQIKSSGVNLQATVSGDLLTAAEQTLSQQDLSSYLKQVQQQKQNQLSLTFEKVPFDELMQWLQTFSVTHAARITQLSATRLPVMGEANVKIVLETNA